MSLCKQVSSIYLHASSDGVLITYQVFHFNSLLIVLLDWSMVWPSQQFEKSPGEMKLEKLTLLLELPLGLRKVATAGAPRISVISGQPQC